MKSSCRAEEWPRQESMYDCVNAEFEKLMKRTHSQAYMKALRMMGNRDDAEDVTQEAYLRAYRAFGTYDRSVLFEKWFFRVLANIGIDLIRRRRKVILLSLDQPITSRSGEGNFLFQIPAEGSSPEHLYMSQIMDERLQAGLKALPEPYRIAVLLYNVEGKSYQEIARIMNCPIGTVRTRIHRGYLQLRKTVNYLHSCEGSDAIPGR